MKHKEFLLAILLLGMFILNFASYSYYSNAASTDFENFSVSGSISGGISNLYVTEDVVYNLLGDGNASYIFPQTKNAGHINMTLAAVGVGVTDLQDSPYTKVVTNNLSVPQAAVPETVFDTPRARMAQYFSIDNFSLIQKIRIYISALIVGGGLFPYGRFQIDIFNATDFAAGAININTHNKALAPGLYIQWLEITINEYLPEGDYFAVFSSWTTGLGPPSMNNNSWLIHNYTGSVDNKGLSLFENSTGWFPILLDNTADFLMEVDGVHYLTPYELDLSAFLNNESLEMRHNSDYSIKSPQLGKSIWESEAIYYLEHPPVSDVRVNVTINRTIGARYIAFIGRYIYDEPTTGTYYANLTGIRWTVDYRKVNSSATLLTFFKHPRDWSVSEIHDAYGYPVIEYGIYYSYIYGEHEQGLWIDDRGDGTQTFDYTANFTSPNYLFYGEVVGLSEVYLGDTFHLEVSIKNTLGDLVTNGSCSFALFNDMGSQISMESKPNTNGTVVSGQISAKSLGLGSYKMIIYWSNEEEYGLSVYSFTVKLSPLLIYSLIAIAVAVSTVFALTYGRRKLAERNWVKSLQHLLVLSSKDGRPMYNYSFGSAIKDTALMSGMISAMTEFVRETMGSKKQLRVIDQEDKKVILSHGHFATVTIMANKDLPIIHKNAKKFIRSFEEQYGAKIQKWTGNSDIFKGVSRIVEDYFPVSMEQKLINKCGFELQELMVRLDTTTDTAKVAEILSQTTSLTEKYQEIIIKHYPEVVNEIIQKANDKLGN
jgi:hypothetical protein